MRTLGRNERTTSNVLSVEPSFTTMISLALFHSVAAASTFRIVCPSLYAAMIMETVGFMRNTLANRMRVGYDAYRTMKKSQKPIILFDIDYTLIDTTLLMRTCMWRFWSIKRLYKECVYPDVVPTLRALEKKATLGIFSQALTRLQYLKIDYSGLSVFFNKRHIYISRNKKAYARKLFPLFDINHVAVVDDREDVTQLLASMGVTVFFLDRKNNTLCPSGAIRITSLLQIPTYVNSMLSK